MLSIELLAGVNLVVCLVVLIVVSFHIAEFCVEVVPHAWFNFGVFRSLPSCPVKKFLTCKLRAAKHILLLFKVSFIVFVDFKNLATLDLHVVSYLFYHEVPPNDTLLLIHHDFFCRCGLVLT